MNAEVEHPRLITFGCRLNAYESQAMRRLAAQAGLGDAVIVNTCAVTTEAVRQARQAIRKARRQHPAAPLIITGCAAQTAAEQFAAMPETDAVLGNEEKLDAASWQKVARQLEHGGGQGEKPLLVGDIMKASRARALPFSGFAERTRAFVQVQTGCNHRCTFCIIPHGRGNARSLPEEEVIAQVRAARAAGHREVVLTGVDITSWGEDLFGRAQLGRLVAAILDQVPELERLRVSSIDVAEIDETFLAVLADEERLLPHLHLSLQAGDDMILKRMKRRHSRAQAVEFRARVREMRPQVVFGADLIAGFPTETEEMFANTLKLVQDCDLVWLHVFPFSPRPGTPAARMPQVDGATIRRRAATLRAAGEKLRARWLAQQVGRHKQVLVERPGLGRAEDNAVVRLPEDVPVAEIENVCIASVAGDQLVAAGAERE